MNAVWANSVGVMIVVLMISFVGIWIWAWLPFHKGNFDRLARLPMRDDAARAAVDEGELQ
jgi:cytochrome c oxidase cbb3-type subunit 4